MLVVLSTIQRSLTSSDYVRFQEFFQLVYKSLSRFLLIFRLIQIMSEFKQWLSQSNESLSLRALSIFVECVFSIVPRTFLPSGDDRQEQRYDILIAERCFIGRLVQ